jgi:di/tricarboxylate transporter
MEEKKTGFWKNFTWKRFMLVVVVFFVVTLAVNLALNYFDKSGSKQNLFSREEITRRICLSLIVGLILTLLVKPKKTRLT